MSAFSDARVRAYAVLRKLNLENKPVIIYPGCNDKEDYILVARSAEE